MKKIIICPHCGKVHVAVPAKSKRNEIVLISTGLNLSDLPSLFDHPDKEQDMKNTEKETKYHDRF